MPHVRDRIQKTPSIPVADFPLRPDDIETIITARVFNNVLTALNSPGIDTRRRRRFLLFLDVDSANSPTTIQFIVQFSDDEGVDWFDYKQGLFASLFYEDTDTASGIKECFSGECAGRLFRLRAVAVGTTAPNTFTVTARVEFLN
jgi:hypothetical protein